MAVDHGISGRCWMFAWLGYVFAASLLQIVPYLISMGTDNDITIRSKAHQQVKELDKKYPGFIQVTSSNG